MTFQEAYEANKTNDTEIWLEDSQKWQLWSRGEMHIVSAWTTGYVLAKWRLVRKPMRVEFESNVCSRCLPCDPYTLDRFEGSAYDRMKRERDLYKSVLEHMASPTRCLDVVFKPWPEIMNLRAREALEAGDKIRSGATEFPVGE